MREDWKYELHVGKRSFCRFLGWFVPLVMILLCSDMPPMAHAFKNWVCTLVVLAVAFSASFALVSVRAVLAPTEVSVRATVVALHWLTIWTRWILLVWVSSEGFPRRFSTFTAALAFHAFQSKVSDRWLSSLWPFCHSLIQVSHIRVFAPPGDILETFSFALDVSLHDPAHSTNWPSSMASPIGFALSVSPIEMCCYLIGSGARRRAWYVTWTIVV